MVDLVRDLLYSGGRDAVDLALQAYSAEHRGLEPEDRDATVRLFANFVPQLIGQANPLVQAAWDGTARVNVERVVHLYNQLQTCVAMLAPRTVDALRSPEKHTFRHEYKEACDTVLLLQTTFHI